jgi:tRNA pseudouridine55 synthase
MTLEGILPVWKAKGFTSHDVVAKARRILKERRIGHTGTLDPEVTGVLPLCIGRATRLVEYIQDLPKAYEAKLVIGVATDTEDFTGSVVEKAEHVVLSEEQVKRVLLSFQGDIEQVPPMYSALKVDGKRLYELARSGVEVERKPRTVRIHEIRLLNMDLQRDFPEVHFQVKCSKGTYIRTLCVDIGKALGYPAAMRELIRISTGFMTKDQCITLEELERLRREGRVETALIPMDQAVRHLPALRLTEMQTEHALQGRKIRLNADKPAVSEEGLVRAYSPADRFLGIFSWDGESGLLIPVKVFS